jgi:TRAP transporter solute receptor, TAXI family
MARFAASALLAVSLAAALSPVPAQTLPPRRSFDIATGPVAGTYFPMGELIARVVSHPPGLARCEKQALCGPPGMVVSARSSDGAVANVLAVNSGQALSGLAQGNVVADAVAGRGAFRAAGRQTHIRVMADLFPEDMQLVVAAGSKIRTVGDLRGKRIALGNAHSGADIIAAEILVAYGIKPRALLRLGAEASGEALRKGKIDAFFFLGGAPNTLIADMAGRGEARLVPVDGKGRDRLIAKVKGLSADALAPGIYRASPRIETISCHTLWIVTDTAPADAVYGLVRSLYHPANRALLAQGPNPAPEIRLGESTSLMSVPLHPGAARFYREAGQLAVPPSPARKALKR